MYSYGVERSPLSKGDTGGILRRNFDQFIAFQQKIGMIPKAEKPGENGDDIYYSGSGGAKKNA